MSEFAPNFAHFCILLSRVKTELKYVYCSQFCQNILCFILQINHVLGLYVLICLC